MKYLIIFSVLFFSACSGPAPSSDNDLIRTAQPGVVDHNVIPKKKK